MATRGWSSASERGLQELLAEIRPLRLAGLLHTRIEIEGRRTGLSEELVRTSVRVLAPAGQSIIWSGGIAHAADIEVLARRGVSACVVGSALYEGTLDLADALERAESSRGA